MNRWLRLLLQLLSLALFGLILWWGGPEAWRQILSGDRRSILFSFLLLGVAAVFSAVRLRLISGALAGIELAPWRSFYYLNIAARALGLIAPRSLSTVGGKSVALRAMGIPLKRAIWIVVLDNSFDLGLLGLLITPALLFLKSLIPAAGFVALAAGLILTMIGALRWPAATGWLLSLVELLEHVPRVASALRLDVKAVAGVLPSSATVLQALGFSVLLNAALVACYYYVAQAVGLTCSWLTFAAVFPITQLSLVLAVTPGGLGLFDASWYGVLLLGGVSRQDALAFVIAQRAYIFVFVLLWAGFGALLSLTVKEQNNGKRSVS